MTYVKTFLQFLVSLVFNINSLGTTESHDNFKDILTTTEDQNVALSKLNHTDIANVSTGIISIVVGIVILILYFNPVAFGICSYFDGCDKMVDKTLSRALYLDGILKKLNRRESSDKSHSKLEDKQNDKGNTLPPDDISNEHQVKKRYISELIDPLTTIGIITYNRYDDTELKKNFKNLY